MFFSDLRPSSVPSFCEYRFRSCYRESFQTYRYLTHNLRNQPDITRIHAKFSSALLLDFEPPILNLFYFWFLIKKVDGLIQWISQVLLYLSRPRWQETRKGEGRRLRVCRSPIVIVALCQARGERLHLATVSARGVFRWVGCIAAYYPPRKHERR